MVACSATTNLMFRHLGVSIDSSDHCSDAAIRALEFAVEHGARVSLWYGQPVPDDPLVKAHCDHRASEALTRAEAAAQAMGVPCRTAALFGERPAQEILDAAKLCGCDVVVMAHDPGELAKSGSVASNLLSLAQVPVLTPGRPARIAALDLLRGEYRRLADLLQQWLSLSSSRARGEPNLRPHRASILAAVEHIRRTVHPLQRCKEASLCGPLRRRVGSLRAEIDELLLLGQRERELLVEIELTLAQPLDNESAVVDLSSALTRYAHLVWTARGREEGIVLPAARRHLRTLDWDRLHARFIIALHTGDGATRGM
jgi:nucleotide-binding universal stress UspA family protein